ncbi:glycosyltransferase [Reyranella sp.]|uniref:glycosyltransferase n=1 Tax=Reyranella sp. TaxID=1929291 RepID=UPI002F938E72
MSPGNLSSNPRLVKEADALQEAGYDVTVIACDYTGALKAFDDEIAGDAPWTVIRLPRRRSERYLNAIARPAARALSAARLPVPIPVAANAYGGPSASLTAAAAAVHADLYIAHYVPALPAAAAAARRHRATLGFDAEDFHSGEGTDSPATSLQTELVMRIERACLPRCAYITASSPLIAEAYAKRYGVAPTTVLNVFPKTMAASIEAVAPPRQNDGLTAYWFSQTIGLDRGLQSFIQAMARSRAHVTLDIRGSNRWGHGDRLVEMGRQLGVAERIRLLPMAPPGEMVKLASPYDIGLSLETDVSENRRLCLTNKVFTYLLAGVPTMMSDTPAQRALAPQLGAAAALVSLSDPDAMARTLDELASSPQALAGAKATALELGRRRYNWDVEKGILVDAVTAALDRAAGGSRCRH